MNLWLTRTISDFTASPVPARRYLLQLGLLVLVYALAAGRTSTASNLAAKNLAASPASSEQTTLPVRTLSDPLAGIARCHTKWTLRSGRRLHVFSMSVGWDDPDDDETSDDPSDDDDGWEGLDAFSETEVPVSAWCLEVGCFESDPETQFEPLWSEPLLFTPLLTLQRLRC